MKLYSAILLFLAAVALVNASELRGSIKINESEDRYAHMERKLDKMEGTLADITESLKILKSHAHWNRKVQDVQAGSFRLFFAWIWSKMST